MSLQKLIDFDNKVDGFTSEEDNKSQSSSSSDSHSQIDSSSIKNTLKQT